MNNDNRIAKSKTLNIALVMNLPGEKYKSIKLNNSFKKNRKNPKQTNPSLVDFFFLHAIKAMAEIAKETIRTIKLIACSRLIANSVTGLKKSHGA